MKCPHCGKKIPDKAAAAALGRAGTGASKRRDVDYAALARKAHEARRANASKV